MAEEDPIEEVIHADEVERAQDEEYIDMDAVRRMLRRSQRQSQMFIIDTLTEFDLEYLDRMLADLPLKWNHLMPCTVAEIFCNAPRHLLDQTWNKLERGNPRYLVHCNVDSTLSEWRPSQFEDAENRLYESFCPAIMCMKTNTFRFVAYKSAKFSATHNNKKRWFAFPSLAYLPTDVKKVVAGDGGLLVCDGGIQPRRPPIKDEKLLPLTHDEEDDYDREVFPDGQSVMLVTNPVTREYYFLPPIPHMILRDKCACLVLVPHDGQSFSMKRNRTASFLAKRRSSASLLLENFEPYAHDPNEYYPPGLRPEFYTKGSSFRGSRVWQHNGSTRFSFLQPKVQPTEDNQLSPKIPTPLPRTPQPRRTIHGSPGDTPGSQREVERIEALMAAEHDIHKKSQVVVEDDVSSTSTEEIEPDPYKNRLEEYCHHYMVIVMGSHHECATESTKNVEELVCAVFRSKEKNEGWFLRTVPFKARLMPPEHGRTGLAFIKNGSWMAVCFGGLLVEEHLEEVPPPQPPEDCDISEDDTDEKSIAISKSSKSSNNSHDSIFCPADPNNELKPPNANPPAEEMEECPVVVKKKLWCEDTSEETSSATTSEETPPPPTPPPEYVLIETVSAVLFVVPIVHEDDSAVAFSFNPLRTEDGCLQSPIVVQPFGWQSPMPMLYAVTRKTVQADTIMVFAIGFDVAGGGNPVPSGNFIHVTDMPTYIFNDIFETIDYSQKEFECTAGNGLICIRVKDFRVLAIYDIQKKTWLRQDYAKYMPTKARARPYQMFANCVYEPNFWQKCDYDDMDTNELPLHLCGPYEG